MLRIILPLAIIAALLFAPVFSETSSGSFTGERSVPLDGRYFVGNTIDCFMKQDFSISGECAPKDGNLGLAIFGAVFVSAVAAALGVLGLLPFIGRLVSFGTTVAGVVVIAGVAFFCLNMVGKEGVDIQWGSYLAGGGGLLTLISGLSGMRRR